MKPRLFHNQGFFHVFNRGVEKRAIFLSRSDKERFLKTLAFYQQLKPGTKFSLVQFDVTKRQPPLAYELIAYCLMPNHFHLLVCQTAEGGITKSIGQLQNSYTRFFNTRHQRIGPLFQGRFKSVPITVDEQLIHVARYIFLNPFVAGLTEAPEKYPWSAYREYLGDRQTQLCATDQLMRYFSDQKSLVRFVSDQADYIRNLEIIPHKILD